MVGKLQLRVELYKGGDREVPRELESMGIIQE